MDSYDTYLDPIGGPSRQIAGDRFILAVANTADGDLMLSDTLGLARQRDLARTVDYDDAYFEKYVLYEGQPIARAINAGRKAIVNKYVGPDAPVLDVGIGSGEFIKSRPNTWGYDVNPKAAAWLEARKRWSFSLGAFEALTFWDVLEHVETPAEYFDRMHPGQYLFTSLPIFDDIRRVRESKHYRPGEHLYYFTEFGFIWWMTRHGFDLLDIQDFETKAGRDSILTFAFRKA